MKKGFLKPAIFILMLISVLVTIGFYACSKDNNDNGGNNGGGGDTGQSVSIKDFAFSASTLTVSAGTTVMWTNNDSAPHTVTADDGSFDSGNIATGGTYSHKFTAAGTFAYHCTIHPGMKASIKVN